MALVIGAMLIAFPACKKSPRTIGNNLIDDNDYIDLFHTDTTVVASHSFFNDSIGTKNVSNALLGAMLDPIFGTTEASFYTQFALSTAGQNFGANAVLDSIVLQLCISGYYGDTTTLQTIRVFELADTLSSEEDYFNYSVIDLKDTDLANGHQLRFHPGVSSHVVGNDTVRHAIIRVPLANELGQYLMGLDSTVYQQPDVFKTLFKGLCVKCDAVGQGGAIAYFNLTNNTYTALQLYYHNANNPDKPIRYDFYVNSNTTYFNHFDHDYTQGHPDFVQQLVEGDTTLGQRQLYLQSMGGVRTLLRFPNVSQWAKAFEGQHVIINEAKLIVPASPAIADSSCYSAPTNLVLVGLNADGSTYILNDNYEGANYFGGTYNASNQTVTFRISRYLQSLVLSENPDYGLSMGISGAAYNAQRWVVNGPEAESGNKLHLEVTYSVVND